MTARIEGTSATFDLSLRCSCSVQWQEKAVSHAHALDDAETAIRHQKWLGTTRVARALLFELAGRVDDAYAEYAAALRCNDVFGRAYCHERRGAYELHRGWTRTGLRSMRAALRQDAREGGAHQERYRAACEHLERELTAKHVPFPPADREEHDKAWPRACELEQPAGFGVLNEWGEPLADAVIEVERRLRAKEWREAVVAFQALDAQNMVDAIGFGSRGVDQMISAGERESAIELQSLVVDAYVIYASWSTSGGEGLARTSDVERERAKLKSI
jgi:tetratricopeptide (TPR) repeat protein